MTPETLIQRSTARGNAYKAAADYLNGLKKKRTVIEMEAERFVITELNKKASFYHRQARELK